MYKFSANLGLLWTEMSQIDAIYKAKEKGFDSPPREYVYFIQLYKYSKDWNTRKMITSETLWNIDYTDFTKDSE